VGAHGLGRQVKGEPVDIGRLQPAGLHVCLIYDNEDERQEIVYRFIESGLRAGERVSYFAEQMAPAEVLAWLQSRGVTPPTGGQFDVLPAEEVYTPDGSFVIDRVLERWRRYEHETVEAGFSAARATGETNWSRTVPGGERIAEYCSRLNQALSGSKVGALCQYDAREFDGGTLFDVLRVHPHMIVGTQVVQNPYYVPPEQFLREHAART
jgi:hypothetical protein